MSYKQQIRSVLFGVATGDALGVPAEFRTRQQMKDNPVTDMKGYGTYDLPAGTWSDDSSLTFCLAQSLTGGFDPEDIARYFQLWYYENHWTPRGEVFDIGIATREAIARLKEGMKAEDAGGTAVSSNGNGSLMRIAPLLFYIHDKPVEDRYELTKIVSSITHGHIRSVIACFYYLEFARQLLYGKNPPEAYGSVQKSVGAFLSEKQVNPEELAVFSRVLEGDISELEEEKISGNGYVVHCLEASAWCLLTTDNYKDAVLKAVNLGDDTDTTAAVTGGLAGLFYGFDAIPSEWVDRLARKESIEELAVKFGKSVLSDNTDV